MGANDLYTIDELALAAGMTPRNVRAYRTKGLLSPPFRVGRRSRYRIAHLHRLRDIRQLREAGLPLKLIIEAAQRGEDLGPTGMLSRAAGYGATNTHDLQDDGAIEADATGDEAHPTVNSSIPAIVVHPETYAIMRTLTNRGLNPDTVLLLALRAARAGNALAADLSLLLAAHADSLPPTDLPPTDQSPTAKTAVIDLATLITRDMLGHTL